MLDAFINNSNSIISQIATEANNVLDQYNQGNITADEKTELLKDCLSADRLDSIALSVEQKAEILEALTDMEAIISALPV